MRPVSAFLRVSLAALLIVANIVVHVLPLFAVTLLKALLPFERVRLACNPLLAGIAESWIAFNSGVIDRLTHTRFVVSEHADLRRDGHYLVLANHQSWVDIFVLQKRFNRRIPLLRFFLKRELFWIPLMGLAWWALDFPFMRRHTREQIARRPELAGRDIETTRRACARFRAIPVSIMNFVEGTRFTPEKHASQASPYRNLLKPRSGGVAFVIDAMGDGLQSILDVTLVYPAGRPTMVDLFADRVPEVRIDVRERPIPREFVGGDYQGDARFRERFQEWMNALWEDKDATCERLLGRA
ncbi:acyltransferase [Dokdonella sp.]|uniref:acyltransferase n=1 Tax=Dokdonella sp. TaxID=2291710 RepID=UPI002625EC58|nr:acyltransferase [Dokdonella sp.]